jgi:hypothetical protein
MGDGKHFIVFPVRAGQLNYVGFVPTSDAKAESWSAIGDRDELASSFIGWDAPVVRLLTAVESCFWWGFYDRKPLQSWTNGRLALLGDAAHAMLPHLGRAATRQSKTASLWLSFSRGEIRPRCWQSYRSTKQCAVSGLASFRRRHGKTDCVLIRNMKTSNNAIEKSQTPPHSADGCSIMIFRTPPLASARIVKIRQLIADCCDATSRLATLSAVSALCRCPTSAKPESIPAVTPGAVISRPSRTSNQARLLLLRNWPPAPAKRAAMTGARNIVKVRLFPQLHVSAAFPQRKGSFVA